MNTPINIAIAEDHQLFRQGVIAMLRDESSINVLFEAENGKDLLDKLRFHTPDVVLMDIRMPVMGGRQALDIIRDQFPQIKVIILSMHNSEAYISDFIAAGASSFLPKNCEIKTIIDAIHAVHEQGYYYDDRVSKSVVSELVKTKKLDHQHTDYLQLTEREIDILRLLCDEKSVVEISSKLSISTRTVEWHKKNIFEKTGAKNLAGLALYAIRHGIIANPEELFN